MLIEFSVGNFRSFKEEVTLSLLAANLRAADPTLDASNLVETHGLRLLRSAALYGANASGKSNLIQALNFMRSFVLRSSKESQAGEPIPVDPFRLSTVTRDAPSYFQIIFTLNDKRYRYGFELDGQRVHAEWLYHTAQRESRVFIREEDAYDISGVFKEGQGLQTRTRDNALFLSVVAQWNGPLAQALLNWFRTGLNVISGLEDVAYSGFTMNRFETDADFRERVVSFVSEADVGIADINIDSQSLRDSVMPAGLQSAVEQFFEQLTAVSKTGGREPGDILVRRVTTRRQMFDQDNQPVNELAVFAMQEQESHGTQKIFNLSGPLMDTLEQGKVLVIDEMEARLHPTLTRAIISLFNSPQTNPRHAQLIFATHDTGLLSNRIFRRDQIWFIEKDRYGASTLYSLAELQVRNDASFEKDYIIGKYGAIPFVGGLRGLFEEPLDVTEA